MQLNFFCNATFSNAAASDQSTRSEMPPKCNTNRVSSPIVSRAAREDRVKQVLKGKAYVCVFPAHGGHTSWNDVDASNFRSSP